MYFLKMKVIQEKERKSLWIGQPAYTENLLKRVGMQDSKLTSTPVDVNSQFQPATNQT